MTAYRPSARALGLLALAVAAAVVVTHAAVLTFGLRFDDYIMLRPFSRSDFVQVLTGNWGPIGTFEDAYYRPLTSVYLAGLFSLFGLNTGLLHMISLFELFVVSWLVGLFLWRESGPAAATVGALLYLVHPVLPDSTSATVLNQMHLLALIIVLVTLILWQARRHDPRPAAWWPIFAFAAVGSLVKEDTVMVLPAVLLLQWCRARFVGDVPRMRWRLAASAGAVVLGLALMRLAVYPHFDVFEPGPHRSWSTIALIAVYGPARTAALMFYDATIAAVATSLVLTLQACGAWRAWRRPASTEGWLWIQGAVLLVCFSLPIAFAYDLKSTRLHLEVLSASLMLAAGTLTVLSWRPARRPWLAIGTAALLTMGWIHLAMLQHAVLVARYPPCTYEDLWFDMDVRAWPVVNDDLKRWIDLKATACEEGRYQRLDAVMDGIHWTTADSHVLLLNRQARSVSFALTDATNRRGDDSARVTIDGVSHVVALGRGVPTRAEYLLTDSWRLRLRAAHRVDVRSSSGAALTVTAIEVK